MKTINKPEFINLDNLKFFPWTQSKRASCTKSVDILQQTCYQQADIRMRSHGLLQLVDDKSVASCEQTGCKLIVKTCYPQPCYKLLQKVIKSLQMTSCNKHDFNSLVAT